MRAGYKSKIKYIPNINDTETLSVENNTYVCNINNNKRKKKKIWVGKHFYDIDNINRNINENNNISCYLHKNEMSKQGYSSNNQHRRKNILNYNKLNSKSNNIL